MTRAELDSLVQSRKSFLCVGLDPDITRIPGHLLSREDPIFEFNKAIIDATKDFCVAYKPNLAFYECLGRKGWESLEKTLDYIPRTHFSIADAKRGDIGNTSTMYARAFFETLDFDAITIAPYMGSDSVKPFLAFEGKWAIILALTSNPGAADFEQEALASGGQLFEKVIKTAASWGSPNNIMFVAGATRPDELRKIRAIIPESYLLIPGVGAQGGDLSEVIKASYTPKGGILVNASRSILYASNGKDFAEKAREEAQRMQQNMAACL